MTQKQIYWLTGSSLLLCSAVVCGLVLNQAAERNSLHGQTGHTASIMAVPPLVPVGDGQVADKGASKPDVTINKRKKTVRGNKEAEVEYNKLTPEEARILLHKGTERAFTGEYTETKDPGTYICKRCNAALYHSATKFESHCGWPSFDDEIKGAVKHRRESDGTARVEIVCANCSGHLGHVFVGEGYTAKNTRHCVNSLSMRFVAQGKPLPDVIKRKDTSRETAETTVPAKEPTPAPVKEPAE